MYIDALVPLSVCNDVLPYAFSLSLSLFLSSATIEPRQSGRFSVLSHGNKKGEVSRKREIFAETDRILRMSQT